MASRERWPQTDLDLYGNNRISFHSPQDEQVGMGPLHTRLKEHKKSRSREDSCSFLKIEQGPTSDSLPITWPETTKPPHTGSLEAGPELQWGGKENHVPAGVQQPMKEQKNSQFLINYSSPGETGDNLSQNMSTSGNSQSIQKKILFSQKYIKSMSLNNQSRNWDISTTKIRALKGTLTTEQDYKDQEIMKRLGRAVGKLNANKRRCEKDRKW